MPNIMYSMCALLIVSVAMLMGVANSMDFHAGDLASEDSLWNLYERWLSLYSVQRLGMDERKMRFNVFKDNVDFIHNFNQKGERPHKLRLNKFGDMTNQEFRRFYAGSMIEHHRALRGANRARSGSFMYENITVVAPSVDWRLKGAVNAIKDQGQCGSCWAFSTIASTESINAIRTKKMVSLSEQELVDCDNTQNQGCNGGLMDLAFEFIEKNGITSEQNYPYTAQDGTCDKTKERSRTVTIDGHEDVPANDETALMKAVMNQPVSVAIDASGNSFQFYSEGVFTGDCGTELDHGVNVVGYGTTSDGSKYWIVRNSWGAGWGEKGYVKMARGVSERGGLCGIAMQASYPIKNAYPSSHIEMKDEL